MARGGYIQVDQKQMEANARVARERNIDRIHEDLAAGIHVPGYKGRQRIWISPTLRLDEPVSPLAGKRRS